MRRNYNLKVMDTAIAVKGFIVNDEGELLVLQRASTDVQEPGDWEIPGGRLDAGEHPELGLKREIEEETGIEVEVICPLGTDHFTRADGQVITMIIFLCKAIDDDVTLSKEHSSSSWIASTQAHTKLSEHYHNELEWYLRFYRKLLEP
jgi:8-oxo-dGTP diphosphatase